MRIGLTMRAANAMTYHEDRDAISNEWIKWIEDHSCTPILVPNNLKNPGEYVSQLDINAIILTNGNDIDNSIPESDYSHQRNSTEDSLLKYAVINKMPVFGICRGMQMINRFFGGQITTNIRDLGAINHVNSDHKIKFNFPDCPVFARTEVKTNSFHDHGIYATQLGADLVEIAYCIKDKIVEALAHKSLPILGVQWHPERNRANVEVDDLLFKSLLEHGNFWS